LPAALESIHQITDRLAGIHALVTGAASGIGAASARRLAREGARLLLADVNGDGAKALAEELGQASVQADVTRSADIERMLDRAYQLWGRLDVLLNNAGIAEVRPLFDLTEAEWTGCSRSTCELSSLCCKALPNACVSSRRSRHLSCAAS
jgi:3-oxoacyl-[acyl-carrier protein] reductase